MDTKYEFLISAIKEQIDEPDCIVGLDSKLDELGLDSLKYMMLIIQIENSSANLSVDVNKIGSVRTVGDLARIVSYV